MEILEKATFLYKKFSKLKIDKEEYVVMKVINFLNQGENCCQVILFIAVE